MSYYETRYTFDRGREKVWRAICEYLQEFIPEDSTVLDLGSGYCDFINGIKAKKKIAVDLNPESKKYCAKDVTFIQAPATDLKKIDSANVVFASNLFEHLTRDELNGSLDEIIRILGKKGLLVIIQPNYKLAYRNYFDDFTHKGIFTHISFGDLLKANGFIEKKVVPGFLPLTLKSKLPKSYLLTKAYLNSPIKPFAGQMLLIFEVKK